LSISSNTYTCAWLFSKVRLRLIPVIDGEMYVIKLACVYIEIYHSIAKLNVKLSIPTKIGTQQTLQVIKYFIIDYHPAETMRTNMSFKVI